MSLTVINISYTKHTVHKHFFLKGETLSSQSNGPHTINSLGLLMKNKVFAFLATDMAGTRASCLQTRRRIKESVETFEGQRKDVYKFSVCRETVVKRQTILCYSSSFVRRRRKQGSCMEVTKELPLSLRISQREE